MRPNRRWRGALVAAAMLFVGSALPLPPRCNPDFGRFGPDKLLHLAGHAAFTAAVVAAAGEDGRSRTGLAAVFVSTAYGVATELLQESVPGREFEFWDVAAGLVGSALGALGCQRVDFRRGSRARRQ